MNEPRVVQVTTTEEFENLREAWHSLHGLCMPQSIFLSWEWLSAWWKVYGAGRDLWLVTAWDGEALVGLAPLMRTRERKRGLPFRILKTLSAPDCDVSGFLVRDNNPQVLNALCGFILQHKADWDVIELNEFQCDLPLTHMLMETFQRLGLKFELKSEPHFYLPLEASWEIFFSSLSKNLRHNIERRQRRAAELGTITYERIKGDQLNWQHYQTIFQINEKGHYPELYRSEDKKQFHREILERMRTLDWIEIHLFKLNDQPVAFQYGFEVGDRYEDWRGGFDLSYPQLSLGKMLMRAALEEHFKAGYHEADFLCGIYNYKADWNPLTREFVKISATTPQNLLAQFAFLWIPKFNRWFQKYSPLRNDKGRNSHSTDKARNQD